MNDKVVRIEHTIRAASDNQARNIFQLAANRLLQVRSWNHLADSLLFSSEHRDARGAPVIRDARADDYINLTSDEQRPFGWMQVTHVSRSVTDYDAEVVLATQPVGLPFEVDNDNSRQTNPVVLSIVRHGLEITSGIVIDPNPFATVFERLVVYLVQWRSLVTGLLSDPAHSGDPAVGDIVRAEPHLS